MNWATVFFFLVGEIVAHQRGLEAADFVSSRVLRGLKVAGDLHQAVVGNAVVFGEFM